MGPTFVRFCSMKLLNCSDEQTGQGAGEQAGGWKNTLLLHILITYLIKCISACKHHHTSSVMWTVLPPTGLACLCLLRYENVLCCCWDSLLASLKLNILRVHVARVKPTATFGRLGQPGTLVNILINTLTLFLLGTSTKQELHN